MQTPLSDEKLQAILDTAIFEFAEHGFESANTNVIADKAGVSVGVIYKYFTDKETLFTECVKNSLTYMDSIFEQAESGHGSLMDVIEQLIILVQQEARVHPEYFKLYLQLTATGGPRQSKEVISLIESSSARLYRSMMMQAKQEGIISKDVDTRLGSFFFDNMIMMLHFSYACDYFDERFKIYCGQDIMEKDELVRNEMVKLIARALGIKDQNYC